MSAEHEANHENRKVESSMRRSVFSAAAAAVFLGLGALGALHEATADTRAGAAAAERFTATTVAMTPRDLALRVELRAWSDDAGRAAVVAALADAAAASKALTELPTLGHLWQSGSGVGYSVKYAYRSPTANGERVTFVTAQRLGQYDLKPWALEAPASPPADLAYSVVELYLGANGQGDGTLSLAAAVQVDAASSVVTLAEGAPRVLANAKVAPKTY
jgi:hypothetical protein